MILNGTTESVSAILVASIGSGLGVLVDGGSNR